MMAMTGELTTARARLMPARWYVAAFAVSAIVAAPLAGLIVIAFGGDGEVWPHLLKTVLPRAALTTFMLMAGVGVVSALVGAGAAWLVTMYQFPGRGVLQWMLVLPLAVPTYLIAFCYLEIWDFSGWPQTTLRAVFGWTSARDYWFPDIRSLPGAVLVMSFVLYPYVYLTARVSFLQQSVCVLEIARTLGRGPWGVFWSAGLPLARPALIAGVTLALMECINDIGTVEFFGVNTLTLAVYTTWLQRGSLPGAAQIACVMLAFVVVLVWLEWWSRRHQRFHHTTGRFRHSPRPRLGGWAGVLALTVCAVPVIAGFAVPVVVLVDAAATHWRDAVSATVWNDAMHTVLLAAGAAVLAVTAAFIVVFVRRMTGSPLVAGAGRFAAMGYAVPGTVLAIGVLAVAGAIQSAMGFLITGTSIALLFAYVVRFLAVARGALDGGFAKLSPNLDDAARSLGRTPGEVLREIHAPLLRTATAVALLLVFVDAMKELPATLLLRPFNFDTLATHIYTLASLDLFEQAAPAALIIVALGLGPVIMLNRMAAGAPGAENAD